MQTVVITSGTLSPIDLYPRILNFNPVCISSLNMTLTRWVDGAGGWCIAARGWWAGPMPSWLAGAGMAGSSCSPLPLACPLTAHLPTVLSRSDCLCPVVLTRGGDQLPVSTKFDMRSDPQVIRNYGGWGWGGGGHRRGAFAMP